MKMEKEQEKEDVLNKLQEKQNTRKRKVMIAIIVILLVIIVFLGFSFYQYFQSPEKTLGIGANIEKVLISEDNDVVYIKLAGGANDKNITKGLQKQHSNQVIEIIGKTGRYAHYILKR